MNELCAKGAVELAGMIASATPWNAIRVRPAGRSIVRVSAIIARPDTPPLCWRNDAAVAAWSR